ncbi:MAG: hypothetical protein IJ587_02325 [Synergistaceae bacterium]|nr:hypothetical protein [Synergistaceae bacterium]
MSEFTQGKWEAVFSSLGEYPYYVTTNSEGNYHQIAFVDTEANARLIAAAPEMYDELYEVLQLLKGKSSYDGDEFDQQAKSIQELFARIDGKEDGHE